jgi:uncharacterized membrane protein
MLSYAVALGFSDFFPKFRNRAHSNMANKPSSETLELESGAGVNNGTRIQSLDLLRGVVMVLMAIDHVRVYSGLPPGGPEAGIFFTRWVTHFCAPAFAFFAGTSAFLYGIKTGDKGKLARFLVTRGLILVALELTAIRFFWTFNLNYSEFVLAGVIWMLGWCMVGLAAMVWLRPVVVGLAGLAIILLQQLFSLVPRIVPSPPRESFARFWEFVYPSGYETFEGISVLYTLVPWIGVMAAGYGFGIILLKSPEKKKRICIGIGATAIALYLLIGSIVIANNPSGEAPFIFRLLSQSKYPASQLFLMMTLGPMILLVPFIEHAKGAIAKALVTFGRVPFFYYLMHILIIHLTALVVNIISRGGMHHEWYNSAPYAWVPEESRWSLGMLYLVFILDVAMLYFLCKWYAAYKLQHPQKAWTKFI